VYGYAFFFFFPFTKLQNRYSIFFSLDYDLGQKK